MRNMFKTGIAMLGISLLAACASHPYPDDAKYDYQSSKALNIAKYAGLKGLKDAKYQDVQNGAPVKQFMDIGYAASNILDPAPGFGFGGGLLFTGLFLLSSPTPENPAHYRHVYAWVPAEAAANAEEANELAVSKLKTAFLSMVDPKGELEIKTRTFKPTFAGNSTYEIYVKPNCPEFHDTHNDTYDKTCSGDLKFIVDYEYRDAANSITNAPPFMTDSKQVRGPIYIRTGGTGIFSYKKLDKFDKKFWLEVSKRLPAWTYIYLPPSSKQNQPPLFISQGKEYAFIRPGTETDATRQTTSQN